MGLLLHYENIRESVKGHWLHGCLEIGRKKSEKNFFKRLIIGVAIFFVFPLVSFLMGLINNSLDNLCITCFNEPGALTCKVESNSSDSANVKVNPNNKEESTSKTGGK